MIYPGVCFRRCGQRRVLSEICNRTALSRQAYAVSKDGDLGSVISGYYRVNVKLESAVGTNMQVVNANDLALEFGSNR